MRFSSIVALAASLSTSAAVYQGFNYGSTKSDGSFNYEADFRSLFQSAKGLVGTSGFTSARLYTMIQGGSSTNEPTQAIQAAIDENVTLLLGLWASGGQGPLSAEITALQSAISQYGDAFTNLVAGISVGSEDLYRNSPTGQAANAGIGADAATVASYISQVRDAIKGTSLSGVPVGHVDTWTAWVDGSSDPVINACDFIGMDAYPYFQNTMANGIENGKSLFNAALAATQAAVGSKPVWITETGWPVSGKTENLAVPSLANAKTYWDEVGCPNFGTVNTWWFTLQDSNPVTPNPSFGIIGSTYSTTPVYDLSCSAVASASSASSQSSIQAPSSSSAPVTGGSGSSGSSSSAVASVTSSAATSVASSLASAASSLSTAATGGQVVSSGGGLSPSEGAGNGIGSASVTTTATTSSPTGVTGGNSTVAVGTGSPSSLKTSATGSATHTSTNPATVPTNAANVLSGSIVRGMAALFVAVAAL